MHRETMWLRNVFHAGAIGALQTGCAVRLAKGRIEASHRKHCNRDVAISAFAMGT